MIPNSMVYRMFYKEFPEITANLGYLDALAQLVIDEDRWQNIRKLKRTENFNFDFSNVEAKDDTDKSKRREYLKRVVFAYRLTDEERRLAGLHADSAWMFKTNIATNVYIHRESRAVALNFPIIFESGKSYVSFYDDDCNELDRHVLTDATPVYYNVENWHTVINQSLSLPRVVVTCSDLHKEWKDIVCGKDPTT